MLDGLLGHGRVLLLWYLPGGLHHADEVLVRGRAHGEVSVIVVPFLSGDNTVVVAAGTIEIVEEVLKDLITSLAALEELGVHADVVDAGNVADGKLAATVSVHHLESFVDHGHTARGQLVTT